MHTEDRPSRRDTGAFKGIFSLEIREGERKNKNRDVLQMLQDDEISVKGRVNSVFVLVFFFLGQTGFCVCFTVSSQRPPRPQHAPFCLRACNLRTFPKVCQCAACPGQPRPSDSAGNKKKGGRVWGGCVTDTRAANCC